MSKIFSKKLYSQSSQKTAFTLIEISLVIILIGVISAAILGSISLIDSAKINRSRSLTANVFFKKNSNLIAWYETSSGDSFKKNEVNDNDQITNWFDISSSSLSTKKNILSTSSANITYKKKGINNIPSIKITSGNLELANFHQASSSRNTIFIVFQPQSLSSNIATLVDSHSSNSSSSLSIQNASVILNLGSTSAIISKNQNSLNFSNGSNYIIAAYFDSSLSKAYINNAAAFYEKDGVNPGSNQLKGLTIGSNKSSTNQFIGYISEIIIFDGYLKESERTEIFSYLGQKYNIAVGGI
jgi:prepilin-type N-terminal cleavage/methylation domain-containing protein